MKFHHITGALAAAIVLSNAPVWAEQKPMPSGPGQPTGGPTSTPTWTVPGAQPVPSNITIKDKSPPPRVEPQNPGQFEERATVSGGALSKPTVAKLPVCNPNNLLLPGQDCMCPGKANHTVEKKCGGWGNKKVCECIYTFKKDPID